ncbi:MAG: ribosome biogenesis GTPase YlqF [Clostridiales bacterium]|nr:ribosome biogenesis GTPase YlqF [Clostridiales bacterium]
MDNKANINWFPGHMAKTVRQIKSSLPSVDAVAEILDARIPNSSRNPDLDSILGDKPRLIVLNKADLADSNASRRWIKYYQELGLKAITVDCRRGRGLEAVEGALNEILKEKIEKNIEKGMVGRAKRLMVVGIPNTGKSSFINKMVGKNKAKAADKPGVTRKNQWFDARDGIQLLDTPGVLWPKFEDPEVGEKLAFIGSIKDDVVDIEFLAMSLLKVLRDHYPEKLSQRYSLKDFEKEEAYGLLELVAKRRGMLLQGGRFDTERAAIMLLDEFRGGLLGRISLEHPSDFE